MAIHCKKEGVDLRDLPSALHIKNHVTQFGVDEEQIEAFVANLANYPNPSKLIEAAAQISESGIPLEKLEDHVEALMAERETLQREIDEGRAILDGVGVDVESRRKIMEEYAQMRQRCGDAELEQKIPKDFLMYFKFYGDYDCEDTGRICGGRRC